MLFTGELAILRLATSWNVTGEYTLRSSTVLLALALAPAAFTDSSREGLLLLLLGLAQFPPGNMVILFVASNKDFRLSVIVVGTVVVAVVIGPIISRLFISGMGSSWVRPLRSSSQ